MLKQKIPNRGLAVVAVIAGLGLIALEVVRPSASVERWFWLIVALALVGLGLAGVMDRGEASE